MENVYHSNWSQPANFSEYKAATKSSTITESSFPLPWPLSPHASTSSSFQFSGFPSTTSSGWIPIQDRAAAASKSHSQAEKRRRDRINAQLSTLRKLIPKSDKMDKAALLGSVIDQVKDLKRKAMEVSKAFTVPTEVDEIDIESSSDEVFQGQDVNLSISKSNSSDSNNNDKNMNIRVSVCCEDRPELFSELIQVLKGLKLSAVRAEVASVGGRIKSVLVLSSNKDTHNHEGVCINSLKQSLKLVLTKIASSSVPSNFRIRSKRQRFFLPSHFSQ